MSPQYTALSCTPPSLVALLLGLAACTNPTDDTANRLPEAGPVTTGDATVRDVAVVPDGAGALDGGGVPTDLLPSFYRFECMEVRKLGSVGADGFQAALLRSQWNTDIDAYKLNILIAIDTLDPAQGTGSIRVASGVGTGPDDQCLESQSTSEPYPVIFRPREQEYACVDTGGSDHEGACVEARQSASGVYGSLDFELAPEDLFYIYAEDHNHTPFNCTPDPAVADAVPLRAVTGTFTVSGDGEVLSGNILGCLTLEEGSRVCSCLNACHGATGPEDVRTEGDCAGCPKGSIALTTLLFGVEPTERCTQLMGEDAFDMDIAFCADRLGHLPVSCE